MLKSQAVAAQMVVSDTRLAIRIPNMGVTRLLELEKIGAGTGFALTSSSWMTSN
jgi:hypothetical protein